MSQPVLHHHTIGADDAAHWLYVLHGIYGAGRNWASFAKRLVEARSDWGAVLVDLRLHGRSQGFQPPHTLGACAHDLGELADDLGLRPTAVLGHSFGGKVALMSIPALSPAQVWVIDSTLSRRTPGGAAHRMLQILKRLSGPFAARDDAIDALVGEGFAAHVAHWMATNLVTGDDGFAWRFDASDIEAMLDDFFRRDLWDVVETTLLPAEIHLVRGTESDVVTPEEFARFESAGQDGRAFAHELRGGHWLHVDNPRGLLELVTERLP